MTPRIAIIAALPRELAPLVRGWRREQSEKGVHIYTRNAGIAVCAGMGPQRAAMAATSAIRLGSSRRLISAGWAGALRPGLICGEICRVAEVIDLATHERYYGAENGSYTLLSATFVAGIAQKRQLRQTYSADLVDMEAAAVARIARSHGIPFSAIKAVSDEADFEIADIGKFVAADGMFRETAFAMHAAIRPWLWRSVLRMGRNSTLAARKLAVELERELAADESLPAQLSPPSALP